jgi:hypothetical protein
MGRPHGGGVAIPPGAYSLSPSIAADELGTRLAALPVATLTADEQAGIRWMREEEKLARDEQEYESIVTSEAERGRVG